MFKVCHKVRQSSLKGITNKSPCQSWIRKVRVSMTLHSGRHAVAIRDCMPTYLITLEKLMSKLMSSLVAATIVGAFSMSAMAADAAKAAPAAASAVAEKPAAVNKTAKTTMKHTVNAQEKKADAAQK
jgi:hypothetical protein